MAVQYIDNLSYKGKKPNFERDQFKTLAEMKAFSEADIDEGHSSYCLEDGKRYTFKSSNSVDSTTGRWRVESNPGGGTVVPPNPQPGQTYFDTKVNKLGIWNGNAWVPITYLVTSVNQITFSSDGGDMPFEVFSNAKWTAK